MPLYEYVCKECDKRFEKLVRMSEDPQAVQCPTCSSNKVERALSTFATSGQRIADTSASCGPVG